MNIYDIKLLKEQIQLGNRLKYIFFWSHKEVKGDVTKACLSQWYDSPFEYNGIRYITAEHYMMAEKARLFNDDTALNKILNSSDPGAAKAIGREIKGFDEQIWVSNRFDIVVKGNLLKFSSHPELKEFLLNTSNRILVEASPIDKIWGVGLSSDDKEINNPYEWKGLNLLGFALMKVRDGLML